jgi:16S rRNA processing protein RimM
VTQDTRICIAKIGAAHGVRGEVRLWPYTQDPLAVTRYGALETKDGARKLEVASARVAKDHLVARLKGVETRDEAEALTNVELYVSRERLPATEQDEFYHADLIGLSAVTSAGQTIGRVIAMHNFGAGDIVEVAPPHGTTLLFPFTNEVVPQVDIAAGKLTIDPPNEVEGEEPDENFQP